MKHVISYNGPYTGMIYDVDGAKWNETNGFVHKGILNSCND